MVAPTAAAAVQKKTPVKAAEGGSGDTQRVQAWEKNIIKEYNGFIYLAPPPPTLRILFLRNLSEFLALFFVLFRVFDTETCILCIGTPSDTGGGGGCYV
jgi:hypothetical protein